MMARNVFRTSPRTRPLHWDSWLLLLVALVCAASFAGIDKQTSTSSAYPTTIPGLTGPSVEASAQKLSPTVSRPTISSGHRTVYFAIGEPGSTPRGSITIDSQLSDGAVNSVSCSADTAVTAPLTVSTNPVLAFCATLPITGSGSDTASWLQSQLSTAKVGYQHRDNHNGAGYDLTYSLYDGDTLTYSIYVGPSRNY